jgi:hypothetical protein
MTPLLQRWSAPFDVTVLVNGTRVGADEAAETPKSKEMCASCRNRAGDEIPASARLTK